MTETKTLSEELDEALQRGFSERAITALQKSLKDAYRQLLDDLEWDLKDEFPGYLAQFVQLMADEAIDKLLRGDEAEMRARLKCAENSWTGRDREHWVIHGKLSEHDPMVLRKQIVEAHADLLKNERILDLEDQVASLVKTVNKLEREKEELWERCREAM